MALRGFGIQTLTTTAQPVFGTTLTAALTNITADPFTGSISSPGSQPSSATVSVASINFFRPGDSVQVGPAAGPFDYAKVTKVTVGAAPAGTLTLQGLTAPHASGQFVILAIPAAQVFIQPIAVTTAIYLGEDSTVSATSATTAVKFLPAHVTSGYIWTANTASLGNVIDTPHLWINGLTNSDQYLAAILLV